MREHLLWESWMASDRAGLTMVNSTIQDFERQAKRMAIGNLATEMENQEKKAPIWKVRRMENGPITWNQETWIMSVFIKVARRMESARIITRMGPR